MKCWLVGFSVAFGLALTAIGLPASSAAAEPISAAGSLQTGSASPAAKIPQVEEAAAAFRKGDMDGALASLRAAAKTHPELPPPQVVIAGWFIASNQASAARAALERAVAEVPSDPEAYMLLADMDLAGHMLVEAEMLFDKAISLSKAKGELPRGPAIRRRALAGLAAAAESRQDWKAVQQHVEALVAESSKEAPALQLLGRALFHQKQPDAALERFREAAKLDPTAVNPEAMLAQLYQQSGDAKSAGKWMLSAIEAAPRDAKVRLAAAQWEFEVGRYDRAEEQARAAVQLAPDLADASMLRGVIAMMRKDHKTAEESFRKVHLQSPGNMAATNNLTLALVEQNDLAKQRLALEYAQMNVRQYGDQPEPVSTLGWVLYRLGRLEESEANLRKAFTLSPGRANPDTVYFMARVLVDRGRRDDARKLLDVIKGGGRFLMRDEAQALVEELNKGAAK